MRFVVTVTGHEPIYITASNWLVALGQAVDTLAVSTDLERVACEQLPNGTVIARELGGGGSFVVSPADDFDGPDLPTEQSTPFTVGNLPQSVLLSNMSHVLRAPLNAVLGYSDLLAELARDRGDDTAVRDLGRIHDAGKQLTDVIEALVEAWRIEAGENAPNTAKFDVSSLLRDTADAIEPAVADAGLRLVLDVPPTLATVDFDPAVLRTAVHRAMRRAIRIASGEVALRAYVSGRSVAIHIRDDGPTPSLEDLQGVFTVFARTDPSGVTDAAEHIRLASSRAALRVLGADMSVAARSTKGTRVTVTVPV